MAVVSYDLFRLQISEQAAGFPMNIRFITAKRFSTGKEELYSVANFFRIINQV